MIAHEDRRLYQSRTRYMAVFDLKHAKKSQDIIQLGSMSKGFHCFLCFMIAPGEEVILVEGLPQAEQSLLSSRSRILAHLHS